MTMQLTDEQLDWLEDRIPDARRSPLGGRPPADKRKIIRGIFWILDNGAKWKDLPRRFGSKSTVRVPTQRHLPGGSGESLIGTGSFASSSWDVTATIGWEKVTERCGASLVSPAG